jgi:NADH dehydrogenase [ubiquinone] 1 alpha subcomplex assembly factor 5
MASSGAAAAAAARRLLLLRHRHGHLLPKRHLSSSPADDILDDGGGGGGGRVKIFDRDLKRRHRDRAAWAMREADGFVDAVADNLLDRLEDCRKAFPSALCLGGSAGAVRRLLRGRGEPSVRHAPSALPIVLMISTLLLRYFINLPPEMNSNVCVSGGIEKLIMMDMSADMVRKWRESGNATDDGPEAHFVVGDEEFLPIKER